jgi:AcrR family transcriptional regulator
MAAEKSRALLTIIAADGSGCDTLPAMDGTREPGRTADPVPQTQPRGIRAQRRAATEADILRVAREHLATEGAAGLSLRAIARELGMVSSGIYRYVESRDELLTRLIVDAYTSLAAQVQRAHAAVPAADLDGRWEAIGQALRRWALAHPHDFALIYGSPVPDYHAPPERTGPPGTAVLGLLAQLAADAEAAGRLAPVGDPAGAARAVAPLVEDAMLADLNLSPAGLFAGLSAWTLLLGTVTSEVFEQLGGDTLPDPDQFFAVMLAMAGRLLLAPPESGRTPSSTGGPQ